MGMEYLDICNLEIRQIKEGEDGDNNAYVSAFVSSGAQDSHYTIMTDRTLRNFATDLNSNNIQLKDSHTRMQGFGVSIAGEYKDGKVIGDFKIVRDLDLADSSYPSSNDFIRAIEEKVITKTSVGFAGGTRKCNICKADWISRDCRHWPGLKYEIVGNDGKKKQVTATHDIDNARLREVSLVDRGSNPDAKIINRAQRHYEEGILPLEVQQQLEQTYDVRFEPDDSTDTKPPPLVAKDGITMTLEELQQANDELRTKLAETEAKVSELEPLAEELRGARKTITEEVVKNYSRVRGEGVKPEDVERFRKRCEKFTYPELEEERVYLEEQIPEKPKVAIGSITNPPGDGDDANADDRSVPAADALQLGKGVNPPWAYGGN